MIRIPGSLNSKNGTKEEVKIMQRWNGFRLLIKPLLFRFDLYLLVSKSKQIHKNRQKKKESYESKYSLQTGVKRNDLIPLSDGVLKPKISGTAIGKARINKIVTNY